MAKLYVVSLIGLFYDVLFTFVGYCFGFYGFNLSTYLLLFIAVVLTIVSIILVAYTKRQIDIFQLILLQVGFFGSVVLNNLLSASHLANFAKWMIQTNSGSFNYDFYDSWFISFLIVIIIIAIFIIVPSDKITRNERFALIFLGFWVGSLVIAGISFVSLLGTYLSLIPVANHWGDKLYLSPDIIVNVLKSLFLSGLFNVLERIVRMSKEI